LEMCSSSDVPMLVIMVYLQNVMHRQCAKDNRKAKLHGDNYVNYGLQLSR